MLGGYSWKKRWCVLKNGSIYYFPNQSDTQYRGVIHLHGAHVSTANESLGKKNALSIQTPNRLFHLIAPTLVECEEWIDLVKNAILLLSERKEVAQDGAALQETLSLTKLPDFEYLAANHSKTVHLKYPANQLDVFALLKDSKSLNAQQCDISYQKPEII